MGREYVTISLPKDYVVFLLSNSSYHVGKIVERIEESPTKQTLAKYNLAESYHYDRSYVWIVKTIAANGTERSIYSYGKNGMHIHAYIIVSGKSTYGEAIKNGELTGVVNVPRSILGKIKEALAVGQLQDILEGGG